MTEIDDRGWAKQMHLLFDTLVRSGVDEIEIRHIAKNQFPVTDEQAFWVSLFKWTSAAALVRGNPRHEIIEAGWETCGFCMLYFAENCVDCPIALKTNETFCDDMPYKHAANGAKGWAFEDGQLISLSLEKRLEWIQEEIDFLLELGVERRWISKKDLDAFRAWGKTQVWSI